MDTRHAFQKLSGWLLLVSVSAASLAADEPDQDDAIVAALISVTQDDDRNVRLAAYGALRKEQRSEALVRVFRRGLADKSNDVRRAALAGLVDMEGSSDEILQLLIASLDDPDVTVLAAKRLVAFGQAAVPSLVDAMQQPDTRLAAIRLLGQIQLPEPNQTAVTALIAALQDSDKEIRLSATRALISARSAVLAKRDTEDRYTAFARAYLDRYDANQDAALTEEEWSSMRISPAEADRDEDGRITIDELRLWMRSRFGSSPR